MDVNNNIKEQKRALRKLIYEKMGSFPLEQFKVESDNVMAQIENMPQFQSAKTVLAYWAMPRELDTRAFIEKWYKEKTFILPLVVGDFLELRVFEGIESLVEGPAYGILEPQKGPAFTDKSIDFGIIPGVAFDLNNKRMGHGKGYYDKLLKTLDVPKFGVCFSFQVVQQVPVDDFDVTLDGIVYPK